jgi:hypothetical protein
MDLLSVMTIEELVLFYFQKKSFEILPYYEIARPTLSHHIILVNNLGLVISICFPQSFISASCLKIYQQIQKLIEYKALC